MLHDFLKDNEAEILALTKKKTLALTETNLTSKQLEEARSGQRLSLKSKMSAAAYRPKPSKVCSNRSVNIVKTAKGSA